MAWFKSEYFTPADTAQLVKDAIGDDAFLLLGFIPAFNDEQLRDLLEDEFFHRHPELDWDSVSASVLADDATSNDLDTFYIAEEAFLDHLNSPNIWDTIITVLHDHYPSALELELCPLEGCDDCDE